MNESSPMSSHMLQCVAVCCSVLQCVAACCSVLQCLAVCRSVLQCAAVCCRVLQCVAVCHRDRIAGPRGSRVCKLMAVSRLVYE